MKISSPNEMSMFLVFDFVVLHVFSVFLGGMS